MKFVFYNKKDKKKVQVIKVESQEDYRTLATIAKCEITKQSILKDLDFSSAQLMCKTKDDTYTMKELWKLASNKLTTSTKEKKKANNKKNKKSGKDNKTKKKKDSGKKSGSKGKSKNKKKDKKKENPAAINKKESIISRPTITTESQKPKLIHMTRL